MDLISRAVTAAISAGLSSTEAKYGHNETGKAYEMLKVTLRRKFGMHSDLFEAVEKLEQKPDSAARRAVLHEEVTSLGADQNPELQTIALALLNKIESDSFNKGLLEPMQRPPRASRFINRAAELERLIAALQPGRVVALWGAEGMGKSALAAEAIWRIAPDESPPALFPDGIIYHSFHNQLRVDIALEQIVRALNEYPAPNAYEGAEGALAERQVLLVLDGIEQADDLPGLLANRGRCGVLATGSQKQDIIKTWQAVEPLSPAETLALLRLWGGGLGGDDDEPARQICHLVGGLPLAVRLVGQYLAARRESAAHYLAWLADTPLAGLGQEQRRQQSVALVLEHSVAHMSESARQALAVVGLLAMVPFEQELIAETLSIRSDQGLLAAIRGVFRRQSAELLPDYSRVMGELVTYGLLEQVGQRYRVTHSLIHTYARQRLMTPAKTVRRLATRYMALAWEHSRGGIRGYARLDADRPHFMRVLAECLEWEEWEAAHGLAAAIEDYLDIQNYWTERVIANEVGLIAAWQLGRPNEGAWLGNLGDTYRTMGHAKWAIEHFEQALATARQTGDRNGEGNRLGNLGLAYRDLGQLEQARHYLEQSRQVFEEIKSPRANLVGDWLAELQED